MKNLSIKSFATMVICLVALACQPDEFPAIGERQAILPQLAGTWRLSQVIQRDNDAERKGFPSFAQQQDITDAFPFSDFTLQLNTEAGAPSTFTIATGDAPNIIGDVTSGTWTVDDVNYPSTITFSGGSGASIELGSIAKLSEGAVSFKLVRSQPKAGVPESVVTYQYSFTKE